MTTRSNRSPDNQEGSVLVIALLMLVFLTLIGIAATTTTEIELQIAGNQQFHKIAFYNADSGVYSSPKVIRQTVEEGAEPTYAAITYVESGTQKFFREVMGYDPYDGDRDLTYSLGGFAVSVDVNRARQEILVGGGAEFASGAEGVGVGSTGGVAVIYAMDSLGNGPASSRSGITAEYRYVPGVAGGL